MRSLVGCESADGQLGTPFEWFPRPVLRGSGEVPVQRADCLPLAPPAPPLSSTDTRDDIRGVHKLVRSANMACTRCPWAAVMFQADRFLGHAGLLWLGGPLVCRVTWARAGAVCWRYCSAHCACCPLSAELRSWVLATRCRWCSMGK